jgi:hypothetical protein
MRRVALAAAVAATAMLVAGCGGPSSEDQVREFGERFTSAIDSDDYATICNDLLAAKDVARRTQELTSLWGPGYNCEKWAKREEYLGDPRLRGLVVSAVSVGDSTATVRFAESSVYMSLKRTPDEGWRFKELGESP